MATTEIDIVNMALWKLGHGKLTASSNTVATINENNLAATLAKTSYAYIRDQVIIDHRWAFAQARDTDNTPGTAPAFGFDNSFGIPSGALVITKVRELGSVRDVFNSDDASTLRWTVEGDAILADAAAIEIEFRKSITDPTKFPPQFIRLLTARLAKEWCMPLTENSKKELQLIQECELIAKETFAVDGQQGSYEKITASQIVGVRRS